MRTAVSAGILALMIMVAVVTSADAQVATRADGPCFANIQRYCDGGNGTVTDTVTGLIWTKEVNCIRHGTWADVNTAVKQLGAGACGLKDGSTPGDWRLPTKAEWEATVEWGVTQGCTGKWGPALSDLSGRQCMSDGHGFFTPFVGITTIPSPLLYSPLAFWSNQSDQANPENAASFVELSNGGLAFWLKTSSMRAWAVRD